MFGLGLPELLVLVVIIGIPAGIIALVRTLDRRHRRQRGANVSEIALPEEYTFRKDPTAITNFLRIMLWIYCGISIVSLLSDFMQMNLLSSASFPQTEAEANDVRQRIIGILHIATFIATGIAFLKWIHRVNFNSHGFGARKMEFTPGWSVGYYFVPFLNLYRPYQAMKEIWKVSKNPADWQNVPGSPLLGWWWALWITSCVLGQISFRMSMAANTVSSLRQATTISILAALVDIPLCIVAVSLISAIFLQQKRLIELKTSQHSTVT